LRMSISSTSAAPLSEASWTTSLARARGSGGAAGAGARGGRRPAGAGCPVGDAVVASAGRGWAVEGSALVCLSMVQSSLSVSAEGAGFREV
jgi:hypothetical protein